MLVEHLAALGLVLHRGVQMFEKTPVAAAHIADSPRLLMQRAVENFDDDLVHLLEIRAMCPSAAPDIHATVDQQLHPTLIHPRDTGIAEQQSAHIVEKREIRNGNSIRSSDLCRVTAAVSQARGVLPACDPSLRVQ